MEGVFSGGIREGVLVETEHGPGTVKKLIRTKQWFDGRERIYVTVVVELDAGERRCYMTNQLRPA